MSNNINIPALKRVRDYILQESEGFDMEVFLLKTDEVACGTKCCIAGTATLLDNPRQYLRWLKDESDDKVQFAATHALGLTESQAGRLFFLPGWNDDYQGWPDKFAKRYNRASTAKGRAKVAADRIDHFIKTRGKE